ncbi:MAG: hypothetical protein HQ553_04410 [Chloroflexi bacterium]|nr:hypothetical protein [Chloroflexota bacterium]
MPESRERSELLNELSSLRGRALITLITSDKKPSELFATQIAGDILPLFYSLLSQMDSDGGCDLLIYSTGGQIDVPWPLTNLLREYYTDINVIVPWKAHSAATLICLGADKIGMGPLASLSPIDPQFQVQHGDKPVVGAGVEDVYGYYRLITETLELDSNGRSEALKLLATRVTPEILGKISRVRREIRIVATNLLQLHMGDHTKIESIVNALVEDLPSHQYLINRVEATSLGLPVFKLNDREEKLSFDILKSYIEETKMNEPGIAIDFGSEALLEMEVNRAFVETKERSFKFRSKYVFHRDGKVDKQGDSWQEVS